MPYSFNPFSGNFDNTPSTLKGDTAYSNVLSNSADWTDGYQTGTIYKANSASYATSSFIQGNFLPLSGGVVDGPFEAGTGSVTLFISGNTVGVNTELPNEALTIVGNISSNSIVYSNDGNSNQWNSVYSSVASNSASYATINFANNKFFALTGGRIDGNVTIFGDLTSTGTQTFANTIFSTTSSLSVVHIGTGPAVWVGNNGSGDIASFNDIDQGIEMLHVGGVNSTNPNVGVKTSTPNKTFTVNGEISASETIYDNQGNSSQWNSAFTNQTNYLPLSGGTMTGKLTAWHSSTEAGLNIGANTVPTNPVNGDIWLDGNTIKYKETTSASARSIAKANGVNVFSAYQTIAANDFNNPALSAFQSGNGGGVTILNQGDGVGLKITSTGAGFALRVEDEMSPDTNSFIVDNLGNAGIGLSSASAIASNKLTVVGNISSTGIIYASGGNSNIWNSVYNTVLANSATAWNYQGTDLKDLSASWQNTYTVYSSNSASYATSSFVRSNFLPLSGGNVNGVLEAGVGSTTLFVSSGIVGINTESPNKALTVVGSISATNTIYTNYLELSDVKFTNEHLSNVSSLTASNDFLKVIVGTNTKYLRLYDVE